jgi:hypothetical protein
MLLMLTGPEPAGQPAAVGGGDALPVTIAVGVDVSRVDPPGFVAVTRARSLCPAEAGKILQVVPTAPAIAAQPPPLLSHCNH